MHILGDALHVREPAMENPRAGLTLRCRLFLVLGIHSRTHTHTHM